MLDSTKSKRPSGRGRIAEVLASARASLKEPSRPHTPRDLDARSSIMSIERSMMNVSSNPIKSNLLLTKPSQGYILLILLLLLLILLSQVISTQQTYSASLQDHYGDEVKG